MAPSATSAYSQYCPPDAVSTNSSMPLILLPYCYNISTRSLRSSYILLFCPKLMIVLANTARHLGSSYLVLLQGFRSLVECLLVHFNSYVPLLILVFAHSFLSWTC